MLRLIALWLLAQAPFAQDIEAFKKADLANPPEPGQILFVGSSSFTRWKDVGDYFPKHKILNRGFGGSSIPDVIRYADDVIFPYKPSQIVIYCGENDLAGNSKLTAKGAADRFQQLFRLIRAKMPDVPIAYVSMKPSPSRWSLRAKFLEANRAISRFCRHEENATFIDVWPVMLGPDGKPKLEIFVADQLHMNEKGYRLWAPLIEPVLKARRPAH